MYRPDILCIIYSNMGMLGLQLFITFFVEKSRKNTFAKKNIDCAKRVRSGERTTLETKEKNRVFQKREGK